MVSKNEMQAKLAADETSIFLSVLGSSNRNRPDGGAFQADPSDRYCIRE
jgi:hypothetical protein